MVLGSDKVAEEVSRLIGFGRKHLNNSRIRGPFQPKDEERTVHARLEGR